MSTQMHWRLTNQSNNDQVLPAREVAWRGFEFPRRYSRNRHLVALISCYPNLEVFP